MFGGNLASANRQHKTHHLHGLYFMSRGLCGISKQNKVSKARQSLGLLMDFNSVDISSSFR